MSDPLLDKLREVKEHLKQFRQMLNSSGSFNEYADDFQDKYTSPSYGAKTKHADSPLAQQRGKYAPSVSSPSSPHKYSISKTSIDIPQSTKHVKKRDTNTKKSTANQTRVSFATSSSSDDNDSTSPIPRKNMSRMSDANLSTNTGKYRAVGMNTPSPVKNRYKSSPYHQKKYQRGSPFQKYHFKNTKYDSSDSSDDYIPEKYHQHKKRRYSSSSDSSDSNPMRKPIIIYKNAASQSTSEEDVLPKKTYTELKRKYNLSSSTSSSSSEEIKLKKHSHGPNKKNKKPSKPVVIQSSSSSSEEIPRKQVHKPTKQSKKKSKQISSSSDSDGKIDVKPSNVLSHNSKKPLFLRIISSSSSSDDISKYTNSKIHHKAKSSSDSDHSKDSSDPLLNYKVSSDSDDIPIFIPPVPDVIDPILPNLRAPFIALNSSSDSSSSEQPQLESDDGKIKSHIIEDLSSSALGIDINQFNSSSSDSSTKQISFQIKQEEDNISINEYNSSEENLQNDSDDLLVNIKSKNMMNSDDEDYNYQDLKHETSKSPNNSKDEQYDEVQINIPLNLHEEEESDPVRIEIPLNLNNSEENYSDQVNIKEEEEDDIYIIEEEEEEEILDINSFLPGNDITINQNQLDDTPKDDDSPPIKQASEEKFQFTPPHNDDYEQTVPPLSQAKDDDHNIIILTNQEEEEEEDIDMNLIMNEEEDEEISEPMPQPVDRNKSDDTSNTLRKENEQQSDEDDDILDSSANEAYNNALALIDNEDIEKMGNEGKNIDDDDSSEVDIDALANQFGIQLDDDDLDDDV